jgi:DNA-binding beta-propeller fold protein YncE
MRLIDGVDGCRSTAAISNEGMSPMISRLMWAFSAVFMLPIAGPVMAYELDRALLVANDKTSDITVIDTETDSIAGFLSLPFPAWQLAVSKPLDLIIASQIETGGIMLIDASDERYLQHIDLSFMPEHMQLSPDGRHLALVDNPNNTVAILDLEERGDPIIYNELFRPHNIVFSADGSQLLIANQEADMVSIITGDTGEFITDIFIDEYGGFGGVTDIGLFDGGRTLVAVSNSTEEIAIIDVETGELQQRVETLATPYHIFSTENGQTGFVTDFRGHISRLSLDGSMELIHWTNHLPMFVHSMMLDSLAVVIAAEENEIGLVDLANGQSLQPIELPAAPERGVVTTDGSKLYLPLPDDDSVVVFDAVKREIVARIDDVGDYPWIITMSGARNYCY